MPSSELTSPAPQPSRHEPDGWAALWRHILQAHATAEVPTGAATLMTVTAKQGWCVTASVSGASADLFALYKPLLDARLAQARHAGAPSWVVAQLGQSLDGCVATSSGDSNFVSGEQSLVHLHCLRALCDAVLVGAGTVAADDPRLTTRRVPGAQPVRVVLDPRARLDGRARVFRDGQAPTLWMCDARHAAEARKRLELAVPVGTNGAEVLAVEGLLDTEDLERSLHPARAIESLAARGLRLVFVEGGGITVSRLLAAGVLDRLHLIVAPVLIGDGRRGLRGPPSTVMAMCPRPPARTLALGEDMLWDLDLRAIPPPRP